MQGTMFGRYRVVEKLAAGGMGEVYTATHDLMSREAVVKILLPEMSADKSIVKRFFNEAQAAASIQHPGIVAVFDVGYADDGRAYIVMEKLPGESLQARLDRVRWLEPAHASALMRQLAGAVGAAHERGIVHRDLKPANVFVVPDPEVPGGERIKVLDFGLAKLLVGRGSLATHAGSIFGTPAYMAPEQCMDAASVDHRADLYAIGCMFYACVCGRPPFFSGNPLQVMMAHVNETVPPPRSLQPALPPYHEGIILNLLQKRPEDRLPSCAAMIEALDHGAVLFPGGTSSAPAPGAVQAWGSTPYATGSQTPAGSSQASAAHALGHPVSAPPSVSYALAHTLAAAPPAASHVSAHPASAAPPAASPAAVQSSISAGAGHVQTVTPRRSRWPVVAGGAAALAIAGLSAALFYVTRQPGAHVGTDAGTAAPPPSQALVDENDPPAPPKDVPAPATDTSALPAGAAARPRPALAALPRKAELIVRIDVPRVMASPLFDKLLMPMISAQSDESLGSLLRACGKDRLAAIKTITATDVSGGDEVALVVEGLTRDGLASCLRGAAAAEGSAMHIRHDGSFTEVDDREGRLWLGWLGDTVFATRTDARTQSIAAAMLAGDSGVDGNKHAMSLIDSTDQDAAIWVVVPKVDPGETGMAHKAAYMSFDVDSGLALTIGLRHDNAETAQAAATMLQAQLDAMQGTPYATYFGSTRIKTRRRDVVISLHLSMSALEALMQGDGSGMDTGIFEELLQGM